MRAIPANEAKARFGQLLDTARREPVVIEKHGRPVAVVLSTEDFEELVAEQKSDRWRKTLDATSGSSDG